MYEASFGLQRRPFSATPDATCFLSAGPIQAALDEIMVCIEQGQGIAVLTAPAGVGKTLMCERICRELTSRFQAVFLRHASFLTRRALLQTLLCELNHAYHHPSEHELRLALFPAIRALRPQREALVVVCDEAHHLPESLLEELRILADFAEAGRPLVRLVLAGQLSLEENLIQPALEAFNQRIRAQVTLPTFDRATSLDYLDYRLTWGGGRTAEIFTPAAMDLIVQVSDGIPRCINQLADHSLLLAFVAEQKPVGEEIIREALNDLRQLPLHWNESASSGRSASTDAGFSVDRDFELDEVDSSPQPVRHQLAEPFPATESARGATYSFESSLDDSTGVSQPSLMQNGKNDIPAEVSAEQTIASRTTIPTGIPHIGDSTDFAPTNLDSTATLPIEADSDDWRQTIELFRIPPSAAHHGSRQLPASAAASAPSAPSSSSVEFYEELIVDRYATIDAGLPPTSVSPPRDLPPRNTHPHRDTTLPTEVQLAASKNVVAEVSSPLLFPSVNLPESDPRRHGVHSHHETVMRLTGVDLTDHNLERDDDELTDEELTKPLTATSVGTGDLTNRAFEHGEDHPLESWDRSPALAAGLNHPLETDRITGRIDTAHECARPAGILETERAPILTTLRRENHAAAASTEDHQESFSGGKTRHPVWESVETEPVAAEPQTRPFQYLFSMLRRKQQQS